ncbi:MAG: hypothetical protein RLZZ584_1521 [Pseudomonadota bacterium]
MLNAASCAAPSATPCCDDLAVLADPPASAPATAPDPFDAEALLLNLHASLRVYARPHFFAWTQGLLQRWLRHDVLVCLHPLHPPQPYGVDSYSSRVPDAAVFSHALRGDLTLVPRLVDLWCRNDRLPVEIDLRDDLRDDLCEAGALHHSAWGRALDALGATRLLLHGCHDVDGEPTGLYLFAGQGSTLPASSQDGLQLLVPLLHAAWLRTQLQPPARSAAGPSRGEAVVSPREQEILKWIYLGKNNLEIGLILGISPLTVKNHVQHLLRKLDVVNRAQAVGKALDARILRL